MKREPLTSVVEDVQYLRDEWQDDVPRATIRRGSALLRRLLVERELGRAWRAAGFTKEPVILGPNLEKLIRDYDRQNLVFALAGGANRGGLFLAAICISSAPLPERTFELDESLDTMMNHPFTLSQYMESACVFVEGEMLKRRDLIKYMANIRGGVHFDNEATAQGEASLYKKINSMDKKINDQVIDGLGYELLSIAQRVAQAPDVELLITEIKKNAL